MKKFRDCTHVTKFRAQVAYVKVPFYKVNNRNC